MSKAIAAVVVTVAVVAVAVFAPEVLPALIPGISSLGVAAITAGLEIGISLASSMLLGPSTPRSLNTNSVQQRLYASLDTTTPRKIIFGYTAAATDVRYHAYTGANQSFYEHVMVLASHMIGGIFQMWLDNELAADIAWPAGALNSSYAVHGRYAGYLQGLAWAVGVAHNGQAIDATWTTDCSLTGCAWLYAKFTLTGPDDQTPSPFQGGVSNRVTVRVQGAYLYDPRLDSSVPGGSGAMQANYNPSWYAPGWNTDRCRNPALQLLFYLLGWAEVNSGKLMVGMGIPPARIDLPSFITAANMCDEAVSLKAGGTEPRYRSDGIISEGDDRSAVIDTLCATMNATLRDAGGKISIQVLHDDLATPVCDFTLDDILGGEEWVQTPPLSDYRNVVRGRFVDASDNALYQLNDYPEQSVTSPDGITRIDTVDFPMVQSPTQAQRLAKLRLMRSQFQGRYTALFGARAWQVSIGSVVRLTHGGLSWTNKLFRVVEQAISPNGQVKMTLLEEDSSIYVWTPATDEKNAIVAGTPPVTNPVNNPLLPPTDATTVLRNSYAKGLRVQGIDAGSSAKITLDGGTTGTNFTIDYGTNPPQDVSVPAGQVSGLAYSTLYYLYADVDAPLDATPTYGATTSYSDAINSSTHPLRMFLNQWVTTPAAGGAATGGDAGGGGYAGSDPGACVTSDTMILMVDGSEKAAGELCVGDVVRTQHEHSLEWGDYPVEAVKVVRRQAVFAAEIEGKRLRATPMHRVWLGAWTHICGLGHPDGEADIVKISVAGARTYVSNGILSHNVKPVV